MRLILHRCLLSVYASDDWGGGGTASASLTADEGIDYIDWYINNEYSFTSTHGGTTSVYEYLGTFTGDIKGTKYEIEAIVSFSDDTTVDSETDKVRVFKPIYTTTVDGNDGIPRHPDVYGYVVLYGHYYDGQNIVMSGLSLHVMKLMNPFNANPGSDIRNTTETDHRPILLVIH